MRVYIKNIGGPQVLTARWLKDGCVVEYHQYDLWSLIMSLKYREPATLYSFNCTAEFFKNAVLKENWESIGGYYSSSYYDKGLQELSIVATIVERMFVSKAPYDSDALKTINTNTLIVLKQGYVWDNISLLLDLIFTHTNEDSLPSLGISKLLFGYYKQTFLKYKIKGSFSPCGIAEKIHIIKEKTLEKEGKAMEKPNVVIGVGVTVVHKQTAQITKIVVNKPDRCVVVFFKDGKKENVKCSPEDEFDPYVGVAIAKARHEFGSTSAFRRAVDSIALVVEPKKKAKKTKTVKKSSVKTTKTTK